MSSAPTFDVGLIQGGANAGDEDLLPAALELARRAASRGAQVVVLPELFRYPYPCQEMTPEHFRYAEAVPGPTTEAVAAVAGELGVVVVASIFEEHAPGLYFNTAAVLDADGRYLGKYRKSHIPDDPLYCEKFYFAPGDTGFRVFETRYARVGVLVCWDQWFPEAARLTAMAGAELLVYPTAIGSIEEEGPEQHALQRDAWQTIQRGHAIANGLYVAAVNRVGNEAGIDFWGRSFMAGPQGEVLVDLGDEVDAIGVVRCERARMRDTRNIWPFFRDRRVDLYRGLERRSLPQGEER